MEFRMESGARKKIKLCGWLKPALTCMRKVVDRVGWVEAVEPERLRDAARVCTTSLTAETQHPRRRGESKLASGGVGLRREVGSESSRVLHPDFLVLRPQPNLVSLN